MQALLLLSLIVTSTTLSNQPSTFYSQSALNSCYENLSGAAVTQCIERVTKPQGERVSPRGSGRIVAQLSDAAIEQQCRYMALHQGMPYQVCIDNWKRANN